MKKLFIMMMMCFISTSVCLADDHPIPVSSLPQQVHTFIAQYFNGKGIVYAEKDRDDGKLRYEVHLSDGTEITFDKKGNWDKIDCEHGAKVPDELVPQVVLDAVKANAQQWQGYGTTGDIVLVITKIDHERYGYDVELSNGIEMKINHQGQVIGYDD